MDDSVPEGFRGVLASVRAVSPGLLSKWTRRYVPESLTQLIEAGVR